MTDASVAPQALEDAAPGEVADAEALAKELLGGPGSEPQSPTEGEPPAPEQTRVELPGLDKIREVAKQRAEERAQREAQLAPVRDLERRLTEQLSKIPTGPSVSVADLQDPARALEVLRSAGVDVSAVAKAHAKAQLGPSVEDQVGALLDAKLAPLMERLKPKEAEPAPAGPTPEARTAAADAFREYVTGGAAEYPRLASMAAASSQAFAVMALEYVDGLAAMGYDTAQIPDAEIAAAIEASLAGPGSPAPQASPHTPSSGPAPTIASGETHQQRKPPASLTNGLAADVDRTPPRTSKEHLEDVVAFARTVLRQ